MNKLDMPTIQQKVAEYLVPIAEVTMANILTGAPLGPIKHYRIYLTKLPNDAKHQVWPIMQLIMQELSQLFDLKESLIYEASSEATHLLIPKVAVPFLQPILKELKATYVPPKGYEPDMDFRAKLLRGEQLIKH